MLNAVDIRQCWDDIRPGLEYIKERTAAPWRPEDVYHACLAGDATLYTGPEGFMVLYEAVCKFTLDKSLHVWIAYGENGNLYDKYMPWLEDLAKAVGAKSITCDSPRRGMGKLLHGWHEEYTRYRRVVG